MTREEIMAHLEMGTIYVSQSNVTEAEKEYNIVINEVHHDDSTLDLLYRAYHNKLHLFSEDEEKRNNLTAIMIEIFSQRPDYEESIYYDIAQFHKISGDYERFMASLDQLSRRYPDGSHRLEVQLELGLAYANYKKDEKKAVRYLVTFLNEAQGHSSVPVAAVNLASCYNALGQPERAKSILQKYMNM